MELGRDMTMGSDLKVRPPLVGATALGGDFASVVLPDATAEMMQRGPGARGLGNGDARRPLLGARVLRPPQSGPRAT